MIYAEACGLYEARRREYTGRFAVALVPLPGGGFTCRSPWTGDRRIAIRYAAGNDVTAPPEWVRAR